MERLREFMEQRRFVATRAELSGQGFSESLLKSWLRTGRLVPLFRGVYSYGRDVETRESVWRAGLGVAGWVRL